MLSQKKEALVQELHLKLQKVNDEFRKLNTKELVKSRTHYSVSGLQQFVTPFTELFRDVVKTRSGVDWDALEHLLSLDKTYYLHRDLTNFHGAPRKFSMRVVFEHGMYMYNFKYDNNRLTLTLSW